MKPFVHALALLLGLTAVTALNGCGEAETPDEPSQAAPHQDHDHEQHGDHSDQADQAEPQEPATQPAGTQAADSRSLPNYVAAPYPMDTCVVAGGELGSMGEPVTLMHEGREVKFCCAGCDQEFLSDPDQYLAKIDAAAVEQQADRYPMDTCPVSDDPLGDDPVDYVYDNRLVRFCCAMCVEPFLKSPGQHLTQLNDAAVEAQRSDYPARQCPVSGQALGSMGEPINMMVGDRLVRLCCAGCEGKLRDNPMAMLDQVYGPPKTADAE